LANLVQKIYVLISPYIYAELIEITLLLSSYIVECRSLVACLINCHYGIRIDHPYSGCWNNIHECNVEAKCYSWEAKHVVVNEQFLMNSALYNNRLFVILEIISLKPIDIYILMLETEYSD
jgi:hypothetical protein